MGGGGGGLKSRPLKQQQVQTSHSGSRTRAALGLVPGQVRAWSQARGQAALGPKSLWEAWACSCLYCLKCPLPSPLRQLL